MSDEANSDLFHAVLSECLITAISIIENKILSYKQCVSKVAEVAEPSKTSYYYKDVIIARMEIKNNKQYLFSSYLNRPSNEKIQDKNFNL